MFNLESFSVWIYDDNNWEESRSHKTQTKYVFSQDRPCDLPKSGFVHVIVNVDEAGQHITGLEGEYFYGQHLHEVLIAKYSTEELASVEQNITGTGSLLSRFISAVNTLTPCQQEELVNQFGVPCFGSLIATLVHLLVFQLAILLLVVAWLNASCFWKNKLLPLYARFPEVEGFVDRNLLKLIAIYIAYLFSTSLQLELKPILNVILSFINTWDQVLVEGCPIDSDFFFAQLNLGLIKAVVWQIGNQEDGKVECQDISLLTSEKDVFTLSDDFVCRKEVNQKVIGSQLDNGIWRKKVENKISCSSIVDQESLSFVTGTSVDQESCDQSTKCDSGSLSSYVTNEDKSTKCDSSSLSSYLTNEDCSHDIYRILESKKGEVERRANQANKSLASHFSTLSNEVVAYAMTEVRRRLEGCVEETIYKSYPRIENYIQSALQEKSDYFFLLKEQLELEVNRVREVCQQAFLVLEAVPQYEERIRYLENEVKALKAERSGDTDLHRKVSHLQSTVTQLLKAVRVRS